MEDLVTPSRGFWRDKRVLLTGHTGFKGAWGTIWLQRMGAQVFGMALEPTVTPSLWTLLGRPAAPGISDIRDADSVRQIFEATKPDIVIHMAAQALVRPSYDAPAETFATNVMGLVHVLEAARATSSVRAIVNVTSDKCYENREQIWAYREEEPMGGSDPYSASKGCAELITASYRRSFLHGPDGPWIASARAGNVIGGGDWSVDRLVPDCLRAFEAGEAVMIRNPLAIRPWQHVLEPVSGYLILAQTLYEQKDAVAEGWNFGPSDEDAWPVCDIVEKLTAIWGHDARWRQDERVHPKEAMLLRVDATKAKLRLGWQSRLPLSEALTWTVDWHKALIAGASALDTSLEQIERYESLARSRS